MRTGLVKRWEDSQDFVSVTHKPNMSLPPPLTPPTRLLPNVLQAAAAEDAPTPLLTDMKAEHSQGAVPDSTGSTGCSTRGEAAAKQRGGSKGIDGGGADAQQQASVTRYVVPMRALAVMVCTINRSAQPTI